MPELPEVEVLVRHLGPLLAGCRVRRVFVHRPRITRPTPPARLRARLVGCRFVALRRRAKYLLFTLQPANPTAAPFDVLGHLGMTGRIYLQAENAPRPKHAAAELLLDAGRLIFEDTRYFGRLTLDMSPLPALGPEPLDPGFTPNGFRLALRRSSQPVKVRLLDQSTVAGVGNIYANESLFRARISPRTPANQLSAAQVRKLHRAIRTVLSDAIAWGSTVPLNWAGDRPGDRLFYYGSAATSPGAYEERLLVYGRPGQPCPRCHHPIRRIEQAGRGTFYCPHCQHG